MAVPEVLQRLPVWLVIGAAVGLLTGFTVGQLGIGSDGDGSRDAASVPGTAAPLPEETSTTTTTTVAPRPASIVCSGSVPRDTEFAAVIGVADAGAGPVAAALEVSPVVERPFAELVGGGFEPFRSEALAAADGGPVLFVARLSSGPLQKDLSQELQQVAPGSVTVVVDPAGVAAPDAVAAFAPPAAVVALDPAIPEPWVREVAAIASGEATCPGG